MDIERHFLRIFRNQFANPEDDGGITIEEWDAFLNADPDVEVCEFIMGQCSKTGAPIKIKLGVGAVWRDAANNPVAVFRFQNGSVVSSGTDEMERLKAQAISFALGAVVSIEEHE